MNENDFVLNLGRSCTLNEYDFADPDTEDTTIVNRSTKTVDSDIVLKGHVEFAKNIPTGVTYVAVRLERNLINKFIANLLDAELSALVIKQDIIDMSPNGEYYEIVGTVNM